jgi:mutator protein MutT
MAIDRQNGPALVAVAVVENGGRFVVGPRDQSAVLGGYWEFPGGKVHAGESPQSAAVRECREETGLVVEAIKEILQVQHDYDHGALQLHFIACRTSGENRELASPFVWVVRAALRELSFPPANDALLKKLLADESNENV